MVVRSDSKLLIFTFTCRDGFLDVVREVSDYVGPLPHFLHFVRDRIARLTDGRPVSGYGAPEFSENGQSYGIVSGRWETDSGEDRFHVPNTCIVNEYLTSQGNYFLVSFWI